MTTVINPDGCHYFCQARGSQRDLFLIVAFTLTAGTDWSVVTLKPVFYVNDDVKNKSSRK